MQWLSRGTMRALGIGFVLLAVACGAEPVGGGSPRTKASRPSVGPGCQIAGGPDLGPSFTTATQQPVDFAVWPAADGTWQLWSCIRGTKEEGYTRLFHRWEGAKITDDKWSPKGIAMRAGRVTPDGSPSDGKFDASYGEMKGGLQAPYVRSDGKTWRMMYGTWGNIAEQISTDGKTFKRVTRTGNDVRIFDVTDSKRDAMFLPFNGVDYLYFTANPNGQGGVYLSTSTDGKAFSEPKLVAFGGQAGTGASDAECPYVVHRDDGYFYLFRTSQAHAACNYCKGVMTYVYASTDPSDFGVNDDSKLIAALPIAAPEIHTVAGVDYIARLLPSVQGIQICNLTWQPN